MITKHTRRAHIGSFGSASSLGLAALALALPALALAAPLAPRIVVNSLADSVADDGACTLREAVAAANSNRASGSMAGECAAGTDSDQIDLSNLSGRIGLERGPLLITRPVSIRGPGASKLAISGGDLGRVIDIANSANTVDFSGLTITNGRTTAAGDSGAGIRTRADLLLQGVVVSNNATVGSKAHGGGVAAYRSLRLVETSVTGNATGGAGSHGAGIAALGSTTAPISLTVERSLIAMNSTGGSSAFGGAVFASGASLSLINSTLSSNSAARSGAVELASSSLTLTHSTLADNVGTKGIEAIFASNSTVAANNSVIAQWGVGGQACSQGFNSSLNTVVANQNGNDGSCGGTVINLATLRIDGLKDNGGPTQTHALLTRSYAIDAAGGGCDRLTVDQRGQSRGAVCDLGAYEYSPSAAGDALPDSFSFKDATVNKESELVQSRWVVLQGLTASTVVSVRGGEWQPAGGEWTSGRAAVEPNTSIRVRVLSAPLGSQAIATLCAGPAGTEVCAPFRVKTLLTSAETEISRLTEDITALRTQLAQAKQEASLHQEIVTDLRRKLAEAEAAGGDTEQLKADLAEARADAAALKKSLADAQAKADAVQKDLEGQITTLKAELESLTQAGKAKDADIALLKQDLADANAKLEAVQKDLDGQIAALKKDVDALTQAGKAKDADIALLKQDVADAKAKLEAVQKDLDGQITALKTEVDALTQAGKAKDADIALLKQDLADAKAKLEAVQKDLDGQIFALKTEVDALTQSGKAKDADIAGLKKDLADAQAKADADLIAANAKVEELTQGIEEKNARINEILDAFVSFQTLQQQKDHEHDNEIAALHQQISNANLAGQQAAQDLAAAKVDVERLTQDVRIKTDELQRSEMELRETADLVRSQVIQLQDNDRLISNLIERIAELERGPN